MCPGTTVGTTTACQHPATAASHGPRPWAFLGRQPCASQELAHSSGQTVYEDRHHRPGPLLTGVEDLTPAETPSQPWDRNPVMGVLRCQVLALLEAGWARAAGPIPAPNARDETPGQPLVYMPCRRAALRGFLRQSRRRRGRTFRMSG